MVCKVAIHVTFPSAMCGGMGTCTFTKDSDDCYDKAIVENGDSEQCSPSCYECRDSGGVGVPPITWQC